MSANLRRLQLFENVCNRGNVGRTDCVFLFRDVRHEMGVLARYINDCRVASRYNITFDKRPGARRYAVAQRRRSLVLGSKPNAHAEVLQGDARGEYCGEEEYI